MGNFETQGWSLGNVATRTKSEMTQDVVTKISGNHGSTVRFGCCSLAQSSPALCDPMDCGMPGLPVLHHLPELAQTHVHCVSDATQPSRPLSSPSPPAFYLSQHQGLFQQVSSLHQVAKVLKLQLQPQSFQWIFRTDYLQDSLLGSLCSPRDSQESSPTPQFKSINSLVRGFISGLSVLFH